MKTNDIEIEMQVFRSNYQPEEGLADLQPSSERERQTKTASCAKPIFDGSASRPSARSKILSTEIELTVIKPLEAKESVRSISFAYRQVMLKETREGLVKTGEIKERYATFSSIAGTIAPEEFESCKELVERFKKDHKWLEKADLTDPNIQKLATRTKMQSNFNKINLNLYHPCIVIKDLEF